MGVGCGRTAKKDFGVADDATSRPTPSELVWMLISSNHVYFPLQIPKLDEAEARGKRARKRRELKRELLRKDPSICTALIYL